MCPLTVKLTTPSINAANISSILPNATLADNVTDAKVSSSETPAPQPVATKSTSSPMAPSEVSPNTAICDRPKVKSVSKKDCKNNRRLAAAAAAAAFQSSSTAVSIAFIINLSGIIDQVQFLIDSIFYCFPIYRALLQPYRYIQQVKHLQ